MSKVFKYTLAVPNGRGRCTLLLPKGAIVRSCGVQGGACVVWCSVDEDAPVEPRLFVAVWTGEPEPVSTTFVGTVTNPDTGIVSHIYEGGT